MPPLVSVRVITYNHEKYIATCLEGVLMQKTNFPFEVIIGEDCSTDHTRQIVLAYQEKYPQIIQVLPLLDENLGMMPNSMRIQQACRGKYHTMLEGDDYWIDPLKLQKQVDLMEAHPDMTFSFHNTLILNAATAGTHLFFTTPLHSTLTFAELCEIKTPTSSVMARADVIATLPAWRIHITFWGDLLFRLWCAHHGAVGYLDEIMSVYRVHTTGATAAAKSKHQEMIANEIYLYEQLDRETHFQHTHLLRQQIALVKQKQLRDQGKGYYLSHPGKILQRVGWYWRALKQLQSVIHFGNTF